MFLLKKIRNYPLSSLLIVVIWVVCLIPIPETPLSDVNLIDKWTHFVMYGSLTTVIWFEYIRRKKQTTPNSNPSPVEVEGGKVSISNQDFLSETKVTSSLPLYGERMPAGQESGWNPLLIGGILCPIIMGGLIELAQANLTTCRSGDFFDFVCNSLGVLLGCCLGLIIKKFTK